MKKSIPVVIAVLLILILTLLSPTDSMKLSEIFRQLGIELLHPAPDVRWATDSHWFRSLLHVPLYLILGVAVALWQKRFWPSAAICAGIGLLDETLKIFLPVRHFEAGDLLFDAVGFVVGILLVLVVRRVLQLLR